MERNCLSVGVGAFAGRWQALRVAALRTADAYWRASRPAADTPDVRVVAAGLEPLAFTQLFDTWREHDDAADANIAVTIADYLHTIPPVTSHGHRALSLCR